MNKGLLLLLLYIAAQSATIVCAPGNFKLRRGVLLSPVINCTNVNRGQVSPRLPTGLTMSNSGVISGTPTENQPLTIHTITAFGNSGTVNFTVYEAPTHVSAGFESMVIYKNMPIMPIRITSDSDLDSVTIEPNLPSGLSFNPTTFEITGTYTGDPQSVTYTVVGTNDLGQKSGSMTLNYQDSSKIISKGIAACYYTSHNSKSLYAESWYATNSAQACVTIESFDLNDNFATTSEHTWPGLDNRFEVSFSAAFFGYIDIGTTEQYEFKLTARDGARLYFDDKSTYEIYFDGSSTATRTVSKNVTLSQGKHLLRLYYVHDEGEAILKLQYQSPNAGLPLTVVDKEVMYIGGYAPMLLTYNTVTSFAGGAVGNNYPSYSGSQIKSWSYNPALPDGLGINGVTGAIYGTTNSQYDREHTITGTGDLGSAVGKVKVVIKGSPVSGLLVSFYSFSGMVAGQICQRQSFGQNDLNIQAITVLPNVNYEEMPLGGAWDGVPGDVFYRFYSVWSGYLKVTQAGDYVFRLQNRDGSRVTLNGNNLFSVWGCLNQMNSTTATVSFSSAGYSSLEILYYANLNSFGLMLEWKTPGQSEFVPIPASAFFHIPSDSFTYITARTKYYKNVQIASNTPVLYGITVTSSFVYSISPSLPDGLTISATTGIISGKPTANSERTTYTVTLAHESTAYAATFSIEVVTVEPPTNVKFTQSGHDITSITVPRFSSITSIELSATNTVRSYTVSPALPESLTLSQTWRTISGRPTAAPGTSSYTVSAVNEGGSGSAQLSITIEACQHGNYFYSSLGSGSSGFLTVRNKASGTVIINNQQINAGLYSAVMCQPVDVFSYTLSCSSGGMTQNDCNFRMIRDDGMIFLTKLVGRGNSTDGELDTVIRYAPTIVASPLATTVAVRQPFSVSIDTTGIHTPIAFTPALPSNLKWDDTTNKVSGTFDKMGFFEYTASCKNEKGEVTTKFTIDAGVCKDNKNLITLSRANGRRQESMKIMKGSEVIVQVTFSDAPWSLTLCMDNGDYVVHMNTTAESGSWIAGNELLIKDTWDDMLSSAMLDNGQKYQVAYFSIAYVIPDLGKIKYLKTTSEPPSGWTAVNFNDKAWLENNADNFGNFDGGKTVYFRKTFQLDNRYKYPLFEFELEIYDGAVAYINGKEVARRNLPAGDIKTTTLAPTRYEELLWRRTGISTTLLNNGDNVLAVELHKFKDATTDAIKFDIYGTLLTGDCLFRGDRGTPSGSDHNVDSRYTPAMAFDKNAATSWRDSNLPIWLQFTYDIERWEFINKLVLRGGQNYNRNHPKKFSLYGQIDSQTQVSVLDVDDRNLFTYNYATVEFTIPNPGTYPAYRLHISQTNNNADTGYVAEMLLYSCLHVYCPKADNYPATLADTVSHGSCPRGSFGLAKRACKKVVFDPVWDPVDTTECLSQTVPSGKAYIDFKYMVSNCTSAVYQYYVRNTFRTIIRDLLVAPKDSVNLFAEYDCSDSETSNQCVYIRVTVPSELGNYVYSLTGEMKKKMSYTFYEQASGQTPRGMYFIAAINPQLYTYQLISPVLLGVIIVVVIAVIITVWVMYTKKNAKGGKRRRRDSEDEKLVA